MRFVFLFERSFWWRRRECTDVRLEGGEELPGYCNGPFYLFNCLFIQHIFLSISHKSKWRWSSIDRLENVKKGKVECKGKHVGWLLDFQAWYPGEWRRHKLRLGIQEVTQLWGQRCRVQFWLGEFEIYVGHPSRLEGQGVRNTRLWSEESLGHR